MASEIASLRDWMQVASKHESQETIQHILIQTYKEWLQQHPEGYICCSGNHAFGEPCKD